MNGATSGTSAGKAEDDLDGVLGRFQEWTKRKQSQTPTPKANVSRESSFGKAALGSEARELSYEQALRYSRYRRPADRVPFEIPPESALPDVENALAAQKSAQQRHDETEKQRPAARSKSTKQPVQGFDKLSASQSAKDGGDIPVQDRLSQWPSKNSSMTQQTGPVGSVHTSQTKPSRPAESLRKETRRMPDFREVLAGTSALTALQANTAISTESEAKLTSETRSIALSLRVSDREGARIRACALQSNISVSAYLRQCALGVDGLRDQVELALAELRRQEAQPTPPPGISAIPGILGRFAIHCFTKLRRNHDYVGISLR